MIKYISRFFYDLKKYRHYIAFSVKSNLKAELSHTVFGYIWWVLDPLLHMLIYTFVVQIVFRRADFAFPVYMFCALLPWKVAANGMQRSTTCVRENIGIIKLVYLPHFILTLVLFLTNSIKLFFGLVILLCMILIYRIPLSWHIIEFIPVYVVFMLFYWGLSLIITHIGVIFSDMHNLITYVIMFWFYASPTMWYLKMLPNNLKKIAWYNPNTAFFTSMRNIFMEQRAPCYGWLAIWGGVSIILIFIGIIVLYRSEKNYSKAL